MNANVEGLSLSEEFAAYWSAPSLELPAGVRELCKQLLLDTLLVGLRGTVSEDVAAVADGIKKAMRAAEGRSTVWGNRHTLAPAIAAFINGTAAHAFEFDDFGGCGHSSAVVVPAVCAIADEIRADGMQVLRALAAGYDLAARVTAAMGGYRAHNDRGWHSTATCGTFGAAAGAAAMLGLSKHEFISALGISGSHAAGTWSFLVDGTATKRLHPGKAASNGVVCAYLAQSGVSGPRYVMEAKWGGFLPTYGGEEVDPQAIVRGLGEEFGVMTAGIKPFPCCRGLHSSVEALLDILAENSVTADDIDRIIVHGAARTQRQFANWEVKTILDGQFSLPYTMATVAVSGKATLDEFVPLRNKDEKVASLMKRVEVLADRELGPYEEPDVEVRLRDGSVFTKHVPISMGAAARPLSEKVLSQKHDALGLSLLGEVAYAKLRQMIADLENVRDFSEISDLLKISQ